MNFCNESERPERRAAISDGAYGNDDRYYIPDYTLHNSGTPGSLWHDRADGFHVVSTVPKPKERMVKAYHIPVLLCILFMACGQQTGRTDLDIAAPVTVQEVTLKPIEEFITTTGTVGATQTVDLKTETNGLYRLEVNPRMKRSFSIGDEVKKGDVLVTLENIELENSVKIDSQKLSLDLSQREYETQKSLYDKGGITLRDLKTAEKSALDAQHSYDNSLIQLSRLKIEAPFDGVITDLTYHTPVINLASGQPIATIANYRSLIMDVNLPAKQLGRIRENQQTRVTNVNLTDKVFSGKVVQVSPALDPTTRAFKATVRVENPEFALKPGMFVKVEIVVSRHENAVVISKDVIIARRQNKTVFVVDSNTAVERRITTGLENPAEVEITEGLSVNDRLVIKGFETLRNRAKVKVTE